MDIGITIAKENPQERANFLSKLTFAWMAKLFYKGAKKGLQVNDLYKNAKSDDSEKLADRLEKNWNKQVDKSKHKGGTPSLMKALFQTFFWEYMTYGIMYFILFVGLRSFQPVVLAFFIQQFSYTGEDRTVEMYASGSIMIGVSAIMIFFMHHSSFGLGRAGMKIRVAVSSVVYRKILKLSKKSLGQTAAGQVVNLLSNDVNRFDLVSLAIHFLWLMPFQVLLVSYLIWRQVGVSTLSGVLSMVLLTLPVQTYLGKLTSKYRLKVAQRTDYRVRLMSEIINGIQVIKMYAWEKPFEAMVQLARRKEVNVLTSASYLRGVYLSCAVFIERTTLYLTIITYVLLGNNITSDKTYSMAQFFNTLQLALALYFPMAISVGAETLVSIKRLQEFLIMEEKQQTEMERSNDRAIEVRNVNASWFETTPTLKNFTLKIEPGKLCAIVGPVGAGKSSALQLLLGELLKQSGTIKIGGDVSYSAQEPWLFVASVRNNILFGLEYDRQKYRKTIKVCALEPDFDQFPQRDQTIVGERGVSLSGGQRARINLARAVYKEADIYLLDDPLSAVDTHVGKHLFEECILKHLNGKTRILVTHQLQYLKKADHIIVLNDGTIEAQGTFEELTRSDLDFTKMLVAADETTEEKRERESKEKQEFERRESILSSNGSIISGSGEVLKAEDNEETYEQGGQSAFSMYAKAGGNWCVLMSVLIILLLGQAFCTGTDLWLTFWMEDEAIRNLNNSTELELTKIPQTSIHLLDDTNETDYTYIYEAPKVLREIIVVDNSTYNILDRNISIYVYTGLIVGTILVTIVRSFVFFKVAMTASKTLHLKMFNALLKAPMRFFDTNPSGRVLNRFSKDMGTIDEVLPRMLLEAIQILLVMCGILISVGYANYYMIAVMVVLGIAFIYLRNLYVATAKDIKHLEGITKSPMFSCVNSTLNGITTIRASGAEVSLRQEFDRHQNAHTSAWYLTLACMASFGLWLDVIAILFVAFVAYSFIILHGFSLVSGSFVGLAISQSLILTGMLQYGMRQTGEVVNQLTSVERVMQYTKLDKEGPFDTPAEKKPPQSWPTQGHIRFQHLYLKYTLNDSPVLKDLNFEILPGEKVGIVGRTGAGKSSLISALFRLAPLEGNIIIDDLNTQNIGLTDLRQRISIIPQEPVLFSATMRYNLDPFNEYDDKKLWSALEEVELKEAIPSLDFQVSEGGSNFSLGQRQLICLARAIVRENKILVLDEATANVDPQTDGLIQKTIRRKFLSCTVLTIAHRLNTIMDSDKVMVMDAGRMIEFDHPHLLLEAGGHFEGMVEQTGQSMTAQLREVAKQAYLKKHNIKELGRGDEATHM